MHKFLIALIFASAITSSNAMAQDAGIIPPTVPPAPVGHAQPTARSFTLNSARDARQEAEHLPLLTVSG
jgi:uncharacterized protein YdeI (BOF family)